MFKDVTKITVRKFINKAGLRFRYHARGMNARAIGDYKVADMKQMDKIDFEYAPSMDASDIKFIEAKWSSKL